MASAFRAGHYPHPVSIRGFFYAIALHVLRAAAGALHIDVMRILFFLGFRCRKRSCRSNHFYLLGHNAQQINKPDAGKRRSFVSASGGAGYQAVRFALLLSGRSICRTALHAIHIVVVVPMRTRRAFGLCLPPLRRKHLFEFRAVVHCSSTSNSAVQRTRALGFNGYSGSAVGAVR
jgi:hypothetical protein